MDQRISWGLLLATTSCTKLIAQFQFLWSAVMRDDDEIGATARILATNGSGSASPPLVQQFGPFREQWRCLLLQNQLEIEKSRKSTKTKFLGIFLANSCDFRRQSTTQNVPLAESFRTVSYMRESDTGWGSYASLKLEETFTNFWRERRGGATKIRKGGERESNGKEEKEEQKKKKKKKSGMVKIGEMTFFLWTKSDKNCSYCYQNYFIWTKNPCDILINFEGFTILFSLRNFVFEI